MLDLSIITINYNTSTETLKCVASILAQTKGLNYEIIIVDNASEWSDFQKLKKRLPRQENIQLVRSKINTGFGGGNMLGVQYSKASTYKVFVNSDAYFTQATLLFLFDEMEKNLSIGISGPQVINPKGKQLKGFNYFHSIWIQLMGLQLYYRTFNKPDPLSDFDSPLEVDYVTGSLLFCRTEDFNAIGGFDTAIFLYYEETDLSKRLAKINKKVMYFPSHSYVHLSGVSSKEVKAINSKIPVESLLSYLYVFKKHESFLAYCFLRLLLLVKTIIKSVYSKVDRDKLKIVFQGYNVKFSMKNQQTYQG